VSLSPVVNSERFSGNLAVRDYTLFVEQVNLGQDYGLSGRRRRVSHFETEIWYCVVKQKVEELRKNDQLSSCRSTAQFTAARNAKYI